MSRNISASDIGIIVLAAGSSQRFGTDKRMARLSNDRSILENTLASVPSTFSHKILVLKKDDVQLAEAFKAHWQICVAETPETGLASSLVSAINCADTWEGALIALADMPYISARSFSAIQNALTEHDIVTPVNEGRRGNPVAFRKKFFSEIKKLKGDQGAKPLLTKHAADIYELPLEDEGIFHDIDRPEMITLK